MRRCAKLGHYDAAAASFERGLRTWEEQEARPDPDALPAAPRFYLAAKVRCAKRKWELLVKVGRYHQAAAAEREYEALRQKLGTPKEEPNLRDLTGPQLIKLLEGQLSRQRDDPAGAAETNFMLAGGYFKLGDKEKARAAYDRGVTLMKSAGLDRTEMLGLIQTSIAQSLGIKCEPATSKPPDVKEERGRIRPQSGSPGVGAGPVEQGPPPRLIGR